MNPIAYPVSDLPPLPERDAPCTPARIDALLKRANVMSPKHEARYHFSRWPAAQKQAFFLSLLDALVYTAPSRVAGSNGRTGVLYRRIDAGRQKIAYLCAARVAGGDPTLYPAEMATAWETISQDIMALHKNMQERIGGPGFARRIREAAAQDNEERPTLAAHFPELYRYAAELNPPAVTRPLQVAAALVDRYKDDRKTLRVNDPAALKETGALLGALYTLRWTQAVQKIRDRLFTELNPGRATLALAKHGHGTRAGALGR